MSAVRFKQREGRVYVVLGWRDIWKLVRGKTVLLSDEEAWQAYLSRNPRISGGDDA